MVKSLDGLIRYLVDEIALRGVEGALLSDFVEYINTYYGKQARGADGTITCENDNKSHRSTYAIDRSFQEQVWKWLTRHPDIRVGKNNDGYQLSLSEFEASNRSRLDQQQSKSQDEGSSIRAQNEAASVSPETQAHRETASDGFQVPTKEGSKLPTKKSQSSEKQNPSGSLRLYSSEYRMWQVAAGHGPDPSKVPALDFACLSIIAARGPKGILQPELVTISGQDKRSLPTRTDRLQQNGYIEKRPVLVSGSRTSLCILKRFVTIQSIVDRTSTTTGETSLSHTKGDNVLDMLSLTRGIFENLRDLEIITTEDLKKKLGVWGFRWPMRVLARTIRQLEALGCVKQVRAQANSNLPTTLYFKCVKLIREPTETEWQLFLSPHRGLLSLINAREGEDVDADGEVDEDYDADDPAVPGKDNVGAPTKNLEEVRRPICQWDGDRCLNNLLFDLVKRSGTQGMSSMDLKRYAFGGLVKRPLEYQLGRLVNQWHISQPPHLRHLAIIRDTAMKRSVTHYVHYSYENFKALVDGGRASWEAVETIAENKKKSKSAATTLITKPDLDEFGFPKLPTNSFQGQLNNATALECASSVKVKPLSLASFDSVPKKLDDGTYVTRPRARCGRPPQSGATESTPQRLSFKPRGRPRKVPRTGLPVNADSMTSKEMSDVVRLQQAAVKYDVLKIEREIDRRVDAGEDRTIATDAVLREVADEHTQLGLPPSLAIEAVRVRSTISGEKEVRPIVPYEVLTENAGKVKVKPLRSSKKVGRACGKEKPQQSEYLPSVAAHSMLIISEPPFAPMTNLESRPEKKLRLSLLPGESTVSSYIPPTAAPTRSVLQPPGSVQSTVMLPSQPESKSSATNNKCKTSQEPPPIAKPTLSHNKPDIPAEHDVPIRKHKQRSPLGDSEGVADDFVTAPKETLKRKRSAVKPLGPITRTPLQYLPSILAHSQRVFLPEPSLSKSEVYNQSNSRGPARSYFSKDLNQTTNQKRELDKTIPPNRTESETRNYKKQQNDIKRPKDGIFIGDRTSVYRKGGNGPRKSRLAIFKLRRLSEFEWYQIKTSSSEQALQTAVDVNNKIRPIHRSRAGAPTSSSARAPLAGQVGPTAVPTHGLKSRTKRKRSLSSPKTHVHPLLDSASTNKDGSSDAIRLRRAEEPDSITSSAPSSVAQASPLSEIDLLKSSAKKLPPEILPSDTPRTLNYSEGAANHLTGLLVESPDKSTHSQLPVTKPSSMDAVSSTPNDTNKTQNEVTGRPEITGITPSSRKETRPFLKKTGFQNDSSDSPPVTDDHPVGVSFKGVVQTRKKSRAKEMAKLPLGGGSIAFLRRKIVMDVVQKCGGVFPSDRELVYPFIYAWQKDGKPGTPERNTVKAACKLLYASGKLRQLYFSFKDKKGLMVTKPMITIPEISPTDPKVKFVQQKIIELYPRPYIPDEAEISEDVRAKVSTNPVYGTNRTFPNLEIDHESRVQLHHKPQYVQRIESQFNPNSRIPEQKPWPEEVPQGSYGFVRRPDLDPPPDLPVRKVQRLASLKRPLSKTITQPLGRPYNSSSRTDTTRGFSLYTHQRPDKSPAFRTFRVDYPNPLSKTLQAQDRRSEVRPDKDVRPNLYMPGIGPVETPEGDSSNMTQAAMLPTTHLPAKRRTKPYLPSIAAHTQPCIRPVRKYRMRQYLPSIAAHTQPVPGQVRVRRQYFKKSQKSWTSEQLQSSRMIMKKLSSSLSGGFGFQYDLLSIVSADVSRTKVAYALNASTSLSIDPWYAHQQISTIMDPDHHFHPVTGTFSSVFQKIKKWDAKTQPIAQKETFRADQVYSNWGLSTQVSEDWLSPLRTHDRTNFEIEIDTVLGWELETEGFQRVAPPGYSFINFTFQHPHILSSNARINMDRAVGVSFSQIDGRILYKPFTPSVTRKPKSDQKIVPRKTKQIAPVASSEHIGAKAPGKRKRWKEPKEQFMSRRLTSLPDGQSYGRPRPSGEPSAKLDADGRIAKFRRVRGPKSLNGLGDEGEKRLIFATLVIRTLTGGIERHIDWVLVARLFAPKFDQMFIQNRWNAVLNKWRFQYERLYPQFQDLFTQGYEDGSIPPIDYDNLGCYDWAWLVDWTMENIEAPTKALPELPAERLTFEDQFTLKETYEHNLHIFFETDVAQPVPLRTNNVLKQTYVYPLQEKAALLPTQESEQLAVAKSWIRANIITPTANYNSELAKERLLTFKEGTIELALKELMSSRVLSQQNKGRLIPGRNYNISQHVMDRLKKNLDLKNFQQAMAYKRQLDIDLEEKGAVDFNPAADDGVLLAVLNMHAHGRIEIRPKNPPMNKFGLTGGGYETRKMDKERLKFTCEIRPKETYTAGNPLLALPPPPSRHLGIPMSRIPLWYDIHDKPVLTVWTTVLAAAMAILSMRPGINAKEMEKSMRPAMEVWELELVLDWMVLAKAAKKTIRGYTTEEWWWMCMDHGDRGTTGVEAGGREMAVDTI